MSSQGGGAESSAGRTEMVKAAVEKRNKELSQKVIFSELITDTLEFFEKYLNLRGERVGLLARPTARLLRWVSRISSPNLRQIDNQEITDTEVRSVNNKLYSRHATSRDPISQVLDLKDLLPALIDFFASDQMRLEIFTKRVKDLGSGIVYRKKQERIRDVPSTDRFLRTEHGVHRELVTQGAAGLMEELNKAPNDLAHTMAILVMMNLKERCRLATNKTLGVLYQARLTHVQSEAIPGSQELQRVFGALPKSEEEDEYGMYVGQTGAIYVPEGGSRFVINLVVGDRVKQIALGLPVEEILLGFFHGDPGAEQKMYRHLYAQCAQRTAFEIFESLPGAIVTPKVMDEAYGGKTAGRTGFSDLEAPDMQIAFTTPDQVMDAVVLNNSKGHPTDGAPETYILGIGNKGVKEVATQFQHSYADANAAQRNFTETAPPQVTVATDTTTTEGDASKKKRVSIGLTLGYSRREETIKRMRVLESHKPRIRTRVEIPAEKRAKEGDSWDQRARKINEKLNPSKDGEKVDPRINIDYLLMLAMGVIFNVYSRHNHQPLMEIGNYLVKSRLSEIMPAMLPMLTDPKILDYFAIVLMKGGAPEIPHALIGNALKRDLDFFASDRKMAMEHIPLTATARLALVAGKLKGMLQVLAGKVDERAFFTDGTKASLHSRISTPFTPANSEHYASRMPSVAYGMKPGGIEELTIEVARGNEKLLEQFTFANIEKVVEIILVSLEKSPGIANMRDANMRPR